MVKSNNTNSFQEGIDKNPFCAMVLGSMNKFRKSLAFTLAEVLITLGIIGIVAAMVIPSLITNYQKTYYLNKLKKVYAILNQAYKQSYDENGESFQSEISDSDEKKQEMFNKYWAPYIKTATICETYKQCGYKENTIRGLDKKDSGDIVAKDRFAFQTADGTVYIIYFKNRLAPWVIVDLDGGFRGPNVFSKDSFIFTRNPDKGIVELRHDDLATSQCSKDARGYNCGYEIFINNWKYPKDYPR